MNKEQKNRMLKRWKQIDSHSLANFLEEINSLALSLHARLSRYKIFCERLFIDILEGEEDDLQDFLLIDKTINILERFGKSIVKKLNEETENKVEIDKAQKLVRRHVKKGVSLVKDLQKMRKEDLKNERTDK